MYPSITPFKSSKFKVHSTGTWSDADKVKVQLLTMSASRALGLVVVPEARDYVLFRETEFKP
jgi:hypothetical protein